MSRGSQEAPPKIAHAPQHTCLEFTSWLLRSESNKIHVFKNQTSNLSGNFTWISCIFKNRNRVSWLPWGHLQETKSEWSYSSSYYTLSAIAILNISKAWQWCHQLWIFYTLHLTSLLLLLFSSSFLPFLQFLCPKVQKAIFISKFQ